ncbi:MAG TPA: hypothetical protein O0X39_06360 [Methanocorpusculum sp.]|nr:hypothetical protein [Methanocorpusculum sp.]
MAIVEIQLNRLGINSLEISTDSVEVSAGTTLHVRITNYGAPTHATLKTEGAAYTPFTYENLYVDSESEIRVPVLSSAPEGSFEIQVICGYGMRRTAFTVNVIKNEGIEGEGGEGSDNTQDPEKVVVPVETPKKITGGIIVVNFIAPILGLVLLILWICLPNSVDNLVMAVILYVIMLIGIVITWRTVH